MIFIAPYRYWCLKKNVTKNIVQVLKTFEKLINRSVFFSSFNKNCLEYFLLSFLLSFFMLIVYFERTHYDRHFLFVYLLILF